MEVEKAEAVMPAEPDEMDDEVLQRLVDERLLKPLPSPQKDESKKKFMERCMGSKLMTQEFPNKGQRYQVCLKQSKQKKK